MIKKIALAWNEERGTATMETIALAAVILILIAGIYSVITIWGIPRIKTQLNGSVERQIDRWHDAGTESFIDALLP